MRRGIAAQMTRAAAVPVAHSTFEADMTAVVKLRAAHSDAYRAREGVGLSFLPFVVKAVAEGLHGNPDLNAHYTDAGLIRKRRVNVGIAIAIAVADVVASGSRLAGAVYYRVRTNDQPLVPGQGAHFDQARAVSPCLSYRGVLHEGDVPRLAHDRIRYAREGAGGKRQDPQTGLQTHRFPTSSALEAGGELPDKTADDRRGLRVGAVAQVQSADGAHVSGGGQTTQKTVTLQQHHLGACPSSGCGRGHARRASADNEHVAGNAGIIGSEATAHLSHFRMCWP